MRGLARMVEEDRYCIDVVTQISAVRAALRRVEEEILRDHVGHCVEHAIASGNKPTAAQDRRTDGRVRPGGPLMRAKERLRRPRKARQRSARRKRRYPDQARLRPAEAGDGLRILIDRLWPRGMPKSKLKLDSWAKHLSPSNALRKWYQHDPEKFAEFRKRYAAELERKARASRICARP